MRVRRRVVCLWAIAGWMALGQPPAAWARDDFQSWNTLELSKRLDEAWELFCLPQIRIRDDAGELFYHEYRQGVRWKPSNFLQVGLNYLFARNESSGKPLEEHTGELDVTPKATVKGFNLSVRGRLALRTIQRSAGEQEWQLRVMPKIAHSISLGGRKITPYVADDLFYEYTRDAWNQNRLFLGVSVPLGHLTGAAVAVDVHYMLQSQLGAQDWNSNHVLGTQLSVQF